MDKLIIVICIFLIVLAFVLLTRMLIKGLKGKGTDCSSCCQKMCSRCSYENCKKEK